MSKVILENKENGRSYEFTAEGAAMLLTNPKKWTKTDELPKVKKTRKRKSQN